MNKRIRNKKNKQGGYFLYVGADLEQVEELLLRHNSSTSVYPFKKGTKISSEEKLNILVDRLENKKRFDAIESYRVIVRGLRSSMR